MAFILKFFPYRIENLLNISSVFPEDLGGFKANIAFIYSALACSLTILDFDFCNAKFDWFVRYQMHVFD